MNNLKLNTQLKNACEQTIHGFVVDEANQKVYSNLENYINRESCDWDINKGLIFIGQVGTGKTGLLTSVQTVFRESKHHLMFKAKPLWQVAMDFGHEGYEALEKYRNDHWFFDELGILNRETVTYFGNKVNVADVLIHERYLAFKKGYLTHFTTNLKEQEIEAMYDERTFSRILEMCNLIPVVGKDRRETSVAKPIEPEKEKVKSPEEIKMIDKKWRQDFLYDPFQELEMTGKYTFDEKNDFIYQYLLKKEIIKVDPVKGKEIYKEERSKFLEKTKKSDIPQNLRTEYSKYVANDFNESNTYHNKVKIECRIRVVREFMNDLIKKEESIGDYFND